MNNCFRCDRRNLMDSTFCSNCGLMFSQNKNQLLPYAENDSLIPLIVGGTASLFMAIVMFAFAIITFSRF